MVNVVYNTYHYIYCYYIKVRDDTILVTAVIKQHNENDKDFESIIYWQKDINLLQFYISSLGQFYDYRGTFS